LGPSPSASAQHAAHVTATTVNVTTTVHDVSAGDVQLLMRSDDFNGSGLATYVTQTGPGHSANPIDSMIDSTGGWKLNLYNQSLRTLWITPNSAINSSQPPGPTPGFYWQNVEAYSKCFDQSNNQVSFSNLVNRSNNCSLGVDFTANGTKYKLVMN